MPDAIEALAVLLQVGRCVTARQGGRFVTIVIHRIKDINGTQIDVTNSKRRTFYTPYRDAIFSNYVIDYGLIAKDSLQKTIYEISRLCKSMGYKH